MLGIGIERDREKRMISFSQTTYIQKMIEHFGMEEAKPLSVPINPGHNLTKSIRNTLILKGDYWSQ